MRRTVLARVLGSIFARALTRAPAEALGSAPGLALAAGLALAGCGAEPSSSGGGGASIMLDIPNGVLDPPGYTSVQVTLHEASGDTVRSAPVVGGHFDLGDLDPREAVSLEAVLRNDNGAAVGYGRTAVAADLAAGAAVTIQVRRPIIYIAGVNGTLTGSTRTWFGLPAAFSDLAASTTLDGTTTAAEKPALMVAAGPSLYAFDHDVAPTTGNLSGAARIRAVSTADHALGAQLGTLPAGLVQDGAGSDDGLLLVVGTTEKLYLVDARPGAAVPVRELATGSFGRVAVVAGEGGALGALAIKNRVSTTGPCNPTAELWWFAGVGNETVDGKMVATGGFSDVAADRGRAWYVDACKGELGEALPTGVRPGRTDLGKPTAIAVSNGQAWIGIERTTPAVALAIVVASVDAASAALRTLWSEAQDQIVSAVNYPGVERRLTAQTATFLQLEIGAGGDYVAATTAGTFHGVRVSAANFPEMDMETRELRVFDAASGGAVERYRSWCSGTLQVLTGSDIDPWRCATSTGQTAPMTADRAHRLSSMTFLFGKK